MVPHDSVSASKPPPGAVGGECRFQCGVQWKNSISGGGMQNLAGDRWLRFACRPCWNARKALTRL
eukprot:7190705-Prorocentrum_lima.AAC.1